MWDLLHAKATYDEEDLFVFALFGITSRAADNFWNRGILNAETKAMLSIYSKELQRGIFTLHVAYSVVYIFYGYFDETLPISWQSIKKPEVVAETYEHDLVIKFLEKSVRPLCQRHSANAIKRALSIYGFKYTDYFFKSLAKLYGSGKLTDFGISPFQEVR